jgi:methylglyoxal synthase
MGMSIVNVLEGPGGDDREVAAAGLEGDDDALVYVLVK